MKRKKLIILSAVAAILIVCLAAFAYAMANDEEIQNYLNLIAGKDSAISEYDADVNADGKVDIIDLILYKKGQRAPAVGLDTLSLDGDYSIDFERNTHEYEISLPAGRPRIPHVTATAAQKFNVEVTQAVIPDSSNTGYAEVKVTYGAKTVTYKINMTKDAANGFNLQYDDRYTFVPEGADGQTCTFESSNTSVASVDSTGKITAKAISSSPVTITAKVNGSTVDELKIDKIEKAQVALFFVTGQSNAQGCYDYTADYPGPEGDPVLSIKAEIENAEQPEDLGMVYCYDYHSKYGNNTYIYSPNKQLFDMKEYKHSGFASALGTNWYNLTGEKVYIIHVAYDGAPIESWLDKNRHNEAGNHGGRNYYENTKTAYADVMKTLENGNYDINRRYRYWLQGETCMNSVYVPNESGGTWNHSPAAGTPRMTAEEYYTYFSWMKNDMKEDFGIDFTGILLVRATSSVASAESKNLGLLTDIVPVRAAQYTLANTDNDISLVSRVCDIALMTTKGSASDEGYGYMGPRNLHYNQTGHNANGKTAAETTYHQMTVNKEEKTGVEMIAENGRTRLTINDTLTLEIGSTYRVASIAVPISTNTFITYSSSDKTIADVDQYGLITAKNPGNAVITASAPDGTSQSVNVKVYTYETQKINYRWDFNNLNEAKGQNNLALSALSTEKGNNNYEFSDGKITSKSSAPDFAMEKPITLTNEFDWTIQWEAKLNTSSFLFATDNVRVNNTDQSFIYLAYTAAFNPPYIFKMVDDNGKILAAIEYGTYKDANNSMNTWKVEYKADTKTLALCFLNGNTWETVGTTSPGQFTATFTHMFGRYKETGSNNMTGTFEYIDVSFTEKISTANIIDYEWNFDNNELTEKDGKNNLTLSEASQNTGNTNYNITDGIYNGAINGNNNAPEFKMDKSFTISNEYSWSIEWRTKLNGGSLLFGTENSTKDIIYLAYGTTGFSVPKPFRIVTGTGAQIMIAYGDYAAKNNTALNTWKAEYNKVTGILALKMLNNDVWETVGTTSPGKFSATFTHMFGRYNDVGLVNLKGSVDYIKVSTHQ